MSGEERRQFARLNILTDVSYTRRPPEAKEKLTLTRNISMGGICLIVYEELHVSDVLDLKVFLPGDNNPIIALGKVAWVKDFVIGDVSKGKRFDVGIEFVQIDDRDAERIQQCVFSHNGKKL